MSKCRSMPTRDRLIACGCVAKLKATRLITTQFTFSFQAVLPAPVRQSIALVVRRARSTTSKIVSVVECQAGVGRITVGAQEFLDQPFIFNQPAYRPSESRSARMD